MTITLAQPVTPATPAVTPTPAPARAPEPEPAAQPRALARTGSDTTGLALAGMGLLALGAVIEAEARRRKLATEQA